MPADHTLATEYFCTYRARLKPPMAFGAGPFGQRMFFEVIDGELEADHIKGVLTSGGGDWLLLGSDGWGRLDVRAQFLLDDGAALYGTYHGYLEGNEAVMNWLATGTSTDWGDHYFRTAPRFETGDERHAWMTRTLFVAEGRLLPGSAVEYRVYRVT